MRPTQILSREHRVIEVVLSCIERLTDRAERTSDLDLDSAEEAIAFLVAFADRVHHGKEEDLLFPLLESRGLSPSDGPTGVMRAEHTRGRLLVRDLAEAVVTARVDAASGAAQFVRAAREYVDLLRNHIFKEDHCLFPMADSLLSPRDEAGLLGRFAEEDAARMEGKSHEHWVEAAGSLARRLGVDVAAPGPDPVARACGPCHDPSHSVEGKRTHP